MKDDELPEGATPIDFDALATLLPAVATRDGLNAFEAANIAEAMDWARRSRLLRKDFPSPDLLKRLHARMFDRTWSWAGRFRIADTNLGVPWQRIATDTQQLCDDARYQLEHGVADSDTFCATFHHRLVAIHPFPNGNGRHARLATDVLRRNMGLHRWNWGASALENSGPVRQRYLAALRSADAGDMRPLIAFVAPHESG